MKSSIIIIDGILSIALITFLIIRNQKDETDLEEKIESDYPKYEQGKEHIEID